MSSSDVGENSDGDRWSELLAKAGRRPDPPPETREAVYLSALLVWQDSVRRRRRARISATALAAALVAAVVGLAWLSVSLLRTVPVLAATVLDGTGRRMLVGESFQADRAAGVLLRTAGGHGLRVAGGSRLEFDAVDRLSLESGGIFFESAARNAQFRIDTRFGEVRHIGTRYLVEVGSDRMWVRVREGQVGVMTPVTRMVARAGTAITIDARGREMDRHAIDTFGPAWRWVDALAPPTTLDGRSLSEVLEEIAFESGRSLQFADAQVRDDCRKIVLKGPLLEMAVGDRLFAVLVTTGLEAVEDGDRILIRRRPESGPGPKTTTSR